jgi:hypothetical protein
VGTSLRPGNFDSPDFDAYSYIQLLENTCCEVSDVKRMWFLSKDRSRTTHAQREPGEVSPTPRRRITRRAREEGDEAAAAPSHEKRARSPDVLLQDEEEEGGAATK